ncbi:L-asparaginase [Citrobacter koseri]|nr:L-asparaginase [Citrobacter koseri]
MGKAVIAIHGGAGAITRAQMSQEQEQRYIQALSDIVETGQKMLEAGESALDVVTEAVRLLEECPLFNAGSARFTRATPPTNWMPASWTAIRLTQALSLAFAIYATRCWPPGW